MVFQLEYDFQQKFPPVLFNAEGLRTVRSQEIDKSFVGSYAGADGRTQRIMPPGAFAGSTGTAGKVRPLPRAASLSALVAASTTTIDTKEGVAAFFSVGETIAALAPYSTFAFSATWAADDTVDVVIDGSTVSVTAAGADLDILAADVAGAINADPYVGRKVRAIADGTDTVYVYAWDMVSPYATSASATTAGDGAVTASGANMAGNVTVGTVASVDVENNQITLSAASAISLPAGFPVGVAGSLPYDSSGIGFGMLSPNEPVDLQWGADLNYGLYIGAAVYADRLPYFDGQLEELFPELKPV